MNIKQKVIISVLMIISILVTNFAVLNNSVKAASLKEIPEIQLKSNGYCGQLLKYKGVIVKTAYVEYSYNGMNYPAYCLDKTLKGVSDELSYSVGINNKIQDIGLWRMIINGYPYKSISELGVANEQEAFTATKQAIYCYLFENTPGDYEAIGEAGQRTLNALNMIVANGQNSVETQESNVIKIKTEDEEWQEDKSDLNYVLKTYSVVSELSHLDYEVKLGKNVPEGTILTKNDGTESGKFSEKESFTIKLLKENLTEDGEISLEIKTQVKTKPVIYGASPNGEWQNYALTGYMYEDSQITYIDTYKKIEKPEEPEEPEESEKPEKTITPKVDEPVKEVKILPVTGM